MRIERIQTAFWNILTLLTIVLMVGLQTLFDRFYPFDGSRMWVSGLSFGVVLWSLAPLSMRFGWFGMTKLDAAKVVKTKFASHFGINGYYRYLHFGVLYFDRLYVSSNSDFATSLAKEFNIYAGLHSGLSNRQICRLQERLDDRAIN